MFTFLIITYLFQAATLAQIQSTNPCTNRNCEYGKTCNANSNDTLGGCKCMQGFKGENCTDMDECKVGEQDPCRHKGLCVNTLGSYRCSCLDSWTGSHCEKNVTSTITCMPGYSGDKCEIALCEHGYAVKSTNKTIPYTCHCDRGWSHDHDDEPCTKDINECAGKTNLCKNGGTCRNTIGSYDCACIKPWEGQNCTYYNSCLLNPCQNGGICTKSGADSDKTHNCTCKAGWQGLNCSTDVNECSLNENAVCFKYSNCTNTPGSYTCMCDTGWSGAKCNESTSTLSTEQLSIVTTNVPSSEQTQNISISYTKENEKSTIVSTTGMPLDKETTTQTEKPSYNTNADTTSSANTQKNLKETKEVKTPVIVGAAVGSITTVAAACVAGYFLYKRKHARVASENITEDLDRNEKFDAKRITKKEAIELPNC